MRIYNPASSKVKRPVLAAKRDARIVGAIGSASQPEAQLELFGDCSPAVVYSFRAKRETPLRPRSRYVRTYGQAPSVIDRVLARNLSGDPTVSERQLSYFWQGWAHTSGGAR